MTTWIIGDVHGCADELAQLIERLALRGGGTLLSCGDLLHRGPDPGGVIDLMEAHAIRFVLGNHERAVLSRFGRTPEDSEPAAIQPEGVGTDLLRGDGGEPLLSKKLDPARVVDFLDTHSGYRIDGEDPALAGGPWCLVHAGVVPGVAPNEQLPGDLVRLRRLRTPTRPYWYEAWRGPELVVFGHTHSRVPRIQRRGGRPVAVGIDTGCVYGGRLTAYSPERNEFCQVSAARNYVRKARLAG